jgi:hypothetical protein
MNKRMRLGFLLGAAAAGGALAAEELGINDLPDIKEGLWQSSTVMAGSMDTPVHSTMCISNAVYRKLYLDTRKNADNPCKQTHSERHGSVITQDTECNFSGKVTHSKSVTTLTGNTAIRLETRDADNKIESLIEMKWVGACPAGMKLGDVAGPDGKVMMNALAP